MTKDDIKKLFAVLQARYGHKWTTAYDDPDIMRVAVNEWHRELSGFRPEDIREGISVWSDSWPPSLPEFSRLCLPPLNRLGFNVDMEVANRLPTYTYMAQNASEESSRKRTAAEIREQVIKELQTRVLDDIQHQGAQYLLDRVEQEGLRQIENA